MGKLPVYQGATKLYGAIHPFTQGPHELLSYRPPSNSAALRNQKLNDNKDVSRNCPHVMTFISLFQTLVLEGICRRNVLRQKDTQTAKNSKLIFFTADRLRR